MKKQFYILFCLFPLSLFAQMQEPPKLIVGIVVDQMCYDYLYRFKSKFSDKGLLKILNNGVNCRNTQYNYVPTYTGPGHASIYTGTTPNNHGIIANEWYDRELKREVNCVEDTSVSSVGTDSKYGMFSPTRLMGLTITDQLKLTYQKSKVISVSIKNRSSILPGGHLSDGSYWYDYASGNFITSSYYTPSLPEWVAQFNQQKQVDYYMEQTWDPLLPIEQYIESEADDSPYEGLLPTKTSPTFPYNFKEMSSGKKPYELFTVSPYANTYLTDFAIEALQREELGTDRFSDFLAISYSTPDIAGHTFGPYSVEMEDMYLRLDLEIEKLLVVLESKVGKDNFILFLTADHAVAPVPQFLVDRNMPGGYVYLTPLRNELENVIKQQFGQSYIADISNNQIYLNRAEMTRNKVDVEKLEETIQSFLLTKKGIKHAYTQEELLEASSNRNLSLVQAGYRHNLSGDVVFTLEAGYLPKMEDKASSHRGTSHGSDFNYDTQVPLIWYGKGMKKQHIDRRIEVIDITATLAPLLNLGRPNLTTGEPILEILK